MNVLGLNLDAQGLRVLLVVIRGNNTNVPLSLFRRILLYCSTAWHGNGEDDKFWSIKQTRNPDQDSSIPLVTLIG